MTLKHKLAFRVGSTTIGRNLFLVTLNANISQTIKKRHYSSFRYHFQ